MTDNNSELFSQGEDSILQYLNQLRRAFNDESVTEAVGAIMMRGAGDQDQGFVTDPELATLVTRTVELYGAEGADRLMRANERFNRPVVLEGLDGVEVVDEHSSNRLFLAEAALCGEAGLGARLSPEQTVELVVCTVNSLEHGYPYQSDEVVGHLTRALQASADAGEQLLAEEVDRLCSLITTAGQIDGGALKSGLSSYAAARKAGLSFEVSVQLVEGYFANANARQIVNNMWKLTEALRSLNIAAVDPVITQEVFQAIERGHPDFRNKVYVDLKDAIEACPRGEFTPSELLQAMAAHLRNGMDAPSALRAVVEDFARETRLPVSEGMPLVIDPREQRDRYFVQRDGRLEHAVLPYQSRHPLNDGLRDLERLTMARHEYGDVIAEGLWVFDDASSTWYSLGGSTVYRSSGMTHTSTLYDVSQLSQTPKVFHIHPKEAAYLGDIFGNIFPTNADYRAMATMLEQAQRPVNDLRGVISHGLGVTEFIFPNDPTRIREVAESFQAAVERYFAPFGNAYDILLTADEVGHDLFARIAVDRINAGLPKGFEIKLHPHGVDLETVMRQQ